jgi:hypothetical protein
MKILENIFQHTNQYILIQPNVSPASDAKLTGKIEIKVFISRLSLAGRLRNNKKSLEKLWGTD